MHTPPPEVQLCLYPVHTYAYSWTLSLFFFLFRFEFESAFIVRNPPKPTTVHPSTDG